MSDDPTEPAPCACGGFTGREHHDAVVAHCAELEARGLVMLGTMAYDERVLRGAGVACEWHSTGIEARGIYEDLWGPAWVDAVMDAVGDFNWGAAARHVIAAIAADPVAMQLAASGPSDAVRRLALALCPPAGGA